MKSVVGFQVVQRGTVSQRMLMISHDAKKQEARSYVNTCEREFEGNFADIQIRRQKEQKMSSLYRTM